jgi:hypothetical protein
MYLQRKSSGSWINVTSWSGSTSSLNKVSLAESYANLITGTTYRVHAVGRVYQNGIFVEQVSATSPNVQDIVLGQDVTRSCIVMFGRYCDLLKKAKYGETKEIRKS